VFAETDSVKKAMRQSRDRESLSRRPVCHSLYCTLYCTVRTVLVSDPHLGLLPMKRGVCGQLSIATWPTSSPPSLPPPSSSLLSPSDTAATLSLQYSYNVLVWASFPIFRHAANHAAGAACCPVATSGHTLHTHSRLAPMAFFQRPGVL